VTAWLVRGTRGRATRFVAAAASATAALIAAAVVVDERAALAAGTLVAASLVGLAVAGRRRRRGVKKESRSLYSDVVLYQRLLRQARAYWPHIGAIFLLSLLSTPLALLTPVPLKIVVDTVVGSDPLPGILDGLVPGALKGSESMLLFLAGGLLVAVVLLDELRALAHALLGAYTGERVLLDFRTRLFRHVQRLSSSYHDAKGTADSTYRIQYDAASIQWIVVNGVTPFITAVLTLAGMIYVTARIDWQLAAVALAVAPALLVLTLISRRRLRRGWSDTKKLESSALSIVQEVLTSLRVVKAFAQEDQEEERFTRRSGDGMRARVRLAAFEGGFGLLIALTTALGTAAVLVLGTRHVQQGQLTLGSLLLVLGYLAQLYAPLKTMSKSVAKLQSSLASAERALAVLDEPPEVEETPHAHRLSRAAGDVEFRDVCFEYVPGQPVLHHVSFSVAAGTRVGIEGPTGAGKTTVMNLLMRFYDPTAGAILLDGTDLRDYQLADLRSQFAIVLQEPVLFSTSIAENIAYARPGAAPDDIVEAARAADVHGFVSALPAGYDSQVGERGMQLSGGERQRISLARAFLRDAPIVILDEPTSSVDVETEATILAAMEALTKGRTTFVIAHRLSTLEGCDARLQLQAGRLHEVGPRLSARAEIAHA
jgi:ATP-binding cassette subfamily B protein